MTALIGRLLEILEEQAACCGRLLELSREKKDVIIRNDVPELRRITRLENTLILKNGAADKAGAAVMRDLAAACSKDPAEFTAGKLAEALSGRPEGERLAGAVNGVRETVAELHFVNGRNRLLIENSLSYIGFSLNLMKDALCGEPFYSADGEEIPAARGFFDAKS